MGCRTLSVLEKCLVVLAACLVASLVAVAVLYATKDTTTEDGKAAVETVEKQGSRVEVCTSQGCITAASELMNSLDKTVDPCDDFFSYACGGWMRKNPIPSGKTSWDVSSKLKAQIDAFMLDEMVDPETRAHYSQMSAVIKGIHYYDSCLNKALIDSLGGGPVMSLLAQYGSCAALDARWSDSAWDLTSTLCKMVKDLDIAGMFELDVSLDEHNTSAYMIMIKEPAHFRITRADLTDAEPTFKNAYRVYMKSILTAAGNVSDADIDDILNFQVQIAQIMDSSGYVPQYARITLAHLINRLGSQQINWNSLLRAVFGGTGYTVDNSTFVVVHGMPFLDSLMTLIQSTSKRTMANFLMWQVIDHFSIDFGSSNVEALNTLMKAIGSSPEYSATNRKEFCFKRAMDIKIFGMPLSRIFVDKKFSVADRTWIEGMVERIKGVFIKDLERNTWMDEETKMAAKEKAQATTASIGYPSYLINNAELDALYNDVTINIATYFDNTVSVRTSFSKRAFARVGKAKQKDVIAMTPIQVNAYYEDSYTRVVFPAAMLQPPFYDGQYTGEINYGAIGSTVGHELLHGFDNAGKDYDKFGNRAIWWTSATLDKFKEKAKCLSDQYSSYSFHGTQINGNNSLSENIADNSGMMQSFQAYKLWKNETVVEPRLPGTNLTSDQIFFISFAQSWCAKITPEEAAEGYKTYSPTPWRVNGTLRNSQAFTEAFKCTSGSPMNPVNKCSVW